MRMRNTALIALAGVLLAVTSGYAVDFYGAHVVDRDVPSGYLRMGVYGFRPVVDAVAVNSTAAQHDFQPGDIILAVNGRDVKRSAELGQFSSDSLSVAIFRRNERITLSVGRVVRETAKARRPAEKQAVAQRPIAHDPPVVAAVAPAVTPAGNAPEKQVVKSAPAVPTDVPRKQDAVPRTVSIEAAVLSKREPVPSSLELLTQDAAAQVRHEAAGKPSKPDCSAPAGGCGPGQPAAKATGMPATISDILMRPIKPAQDRIVFENSKGQVVFSHSSHLKSLDRVQCLMCHQTPNPTPESIQSRLDDHRAAHGFCRGCHQKAGGGPTTECLGCHDYRKKG